MDFKRKVRSRPEPTEGNILLAEDDEIVATVVVRKLEGEGFRVHHTLNGEAALAAASEGNYRLFIFDVKMPVRSGFDLLARIRELPGCRETPVLMLTGSNRDADVRTGIKLGADDYMLKPFMPYELARRVRHLLARKRA